MWSPLVLLCALSMAWAAVLPTKPARRIADEEFLKKQKQVLDLYVGIGHTRHFSNEATFDISANIDKFADPKYPEEFLRAYKSGYIPYDAVFTMSCPHTRKAAFRLFDLFYFSKDFETFIKVATWARHNINPYLYGFVLTAALTHRSDCYSFIIPPVYEIAPNYFVPEETLHQVIDAKLIGQNEGKFSYNNTGYEYNYHGQMFGSLLTPDNRGHGEYRISYFREDVGLNAFYSLWKIQNAPWMCPHKYGKSNLNQRGENFYNMHQQLLARYTLERKSWDLPFVEILRWKEPIKVGYNPRLMELNGKSFYPRPDNLIPSKFSPIQTTKAEAIEKRIWDVIDSKSIWNIANKTILSLEGNDALEILGRTIFGTTDSFTKSFYQSLYYSGIDALAYVVSTGSDRAYVGNALSNTFTTLRDPVFYNYLARLMTFFQHHKQYLHPYHQADLAFKGVKVQKFEVDKFLTFFDHFDYEVTNGVPLPKEEDYMHNKFYARQFRLNHKPYNYKITVNSETACDAIFRVFIGLKEDSDYHLMTINQARLSYFEIDRFIGQLAVGVNTLERNSKESPLFVDDPEGFRSLYNAINNAINKKEPYYVTDRNRCGWPSRLQLPMGWPEGQRFVVAVVASPFEPKQPQQDSTFEVACGSPRFNDGRPAGFPFDRPIHDEEFNVPNILFTDVNVYYMEEAELNRPQS